MSEHRQAVHRHRKALRRLAESEPTSEQAGRLRIVERHAPEPEPHFLHGVLCRYCNSRGYDSACEWPCPDFFDAAAEADR